MTNSRKNIALIGTGLMGMGIGYSLLRAGFNLYVKPHKNRENPELLAEAGATICENNADLVKECAYIVICVDRWESVQKLFFEDSALIDCLHGGHFVIDCTTSHPDFTSKLYDSLCEKGIRYVDAPLTRTPKEAHEGRLNSLVGSVDQTTFDEAQTVLSAFCENIFHVGPVLTGQKIKLLNNFVTLSGLAIAAEAINASNRLGIEISTLNAVFSKGGAYTPAFQALIKYIVDGENNLQFSLANALKDLQYYQDITSGDPSLVEGFLDVYGNTIQKKGKSKLLTELIYT